MKTDINLWDKNEPARIPRTIEDWERTNLSIPLALPRKRGKHYLADFSVDEVTRSLDKASNLIALHGEDFARATEKISPEAWRLLSYRGNYTLEQLSNLRFSALQSLQQNCRISDDFEDPPIEWLGIWGRWKLYAERPDGDNAGLKELLNDKAARSAAAARSA